MRAESQILHFPASSGKENTAITGTASAWTPSAGADLIATSLPGAIPERPRVDASRMPGASTRTPDSPIATRPSVVKAPVQEDMHEQPVPDRSPGRQIQSFVTAPAASVGEGLTRELPGSNDALLERVFAAVDERRVAEPDTQQRSSVSPAKAGGLTAAAVAAVFGLAACSTPDGPHSSDFAGYGVVAEHQIKEVKAEFTVPTIVHCPPDVASEMGVWAGIQEGKDWSGGGILFASGMTVEQAGIVIECAKDGDPSYRLFMEMVPEPPVMGDAVNPGDVIHVDIKYDGDYNFTLTVKDNTNGDEWRSTQECGGLYDCPRDEAVVAAEEVTGLGLSRELPVWTKLTIIKASVNEDGETSRLRNLPNLKRFNDTSSEQPGTKLSEIENIKHGGFNIVRIHPLLQK